MPLAAECTVASDADNLLAPPLREHVPLEGWLDAGQELEAIPTAGTGGNFAVSNPLAVSTPTTAAGRYRDQSFTADSLIYDHVSVR
jgi:hypothetical protein